MTIPLHLTLTGRPLLLHAPIVPEMQTLLAQAYTHRAGRLADRAQRLAARRGGIFPSLFNRDPHPAALEVELDDGDTPPGPAAASPTSRIRLSAADITPSTDPYIAEITIRGPLLNRAEYFMGTLCVDGYDRIEAHLTEAMADPACHGILLDVDSPGGMVNGCFELADRIRAWRDRKPIIAYTDGLACSAAYAIASAATELHGSLTAFIGSIGVIYGRQDASRKGEKDGDIVHFFTSGDRKAFGYPESPINDQERDETQAQIDELADMFFDRVALARGLTVDAIRDLQAGHWLTDTAITHGLADSRTDRAGALDRLTNLIATPDSALSPDGPTPDADPDDDAAASRPVVASGGAASPAVAGRGGARSDSNRASSGRPITQRRPAVPVGSSPIDPPDQSASSPADPKRSASRSTEQETQMSIKAPSVKSLRARASLGAGLAAMATAIAHAETPGLDPDALTAAVQAETDDTLDAMDDDEVEAMEDDDELEAMEDEDEVEAASDEDMDAADEDEERAPSARVTATRIARAATAKLNAETPKASGKPGQRKASASSESIDPDVAAAIQNLPEAKGREKQAAALSITAGMTVANARRILGASAKEGTSRLNGVPNPDVGGSGASKPKPGDALLAAVERRNKVGATGR